MLSHSCIFLRLNSTAHGIYFLRILQLINLILKILWPFKITIHSVANIQQINMFSIPFGRFWNMDSLETPSQPR